MQNKQVSIVIPTYNEQDSISYCLKSLQNQTFQDLEIIIVDDGSQDKTKQIVKKFNVKLLSQAHNGPGVARNLGVKHASGEIIVFVDADMTFDQNFVKDLIKPILSGKTIGTFSKNEMNSNYKNRWSRLWNLNRGWPPDRLIPYDYPNEAPVFRAILKSEFDKVGGFDIDGDYADDWSLSAKLGIKSKAVTGATYYHNNPSTLSEVFLQSRWIGKNRFISGSLLRKIKSFVFYSPIVSLAISLSKSKKFGSSFIIFKTIYDFGVWTSVVGSFVGTKKYK